jgi:hypothetical protein
MVNLDCMIMEKLIQSRKLDIVNYVVTTAGKAMLMSRLQQLSSYRRDKNELIILSFINLASGQRHIKQINRKEIKCFVRIKNHEF